MVCDHIFQNKILKFAKTEYEYVFLNNKPFGANNILNPEDLSVKHSIWGLEGLLQHYGFPTVWLDVTFDLKTAMYFACTKNESDFGYLYYQEDYNSNWGVLTDLDLFAKDLRQIIPIPESRPEKQNALALRVWDWKNDVRPAFKCVKFRKEDCEFGNDDFYFPKDTLETWFKGQLIDYYFDFLERSNRFLKEQGTDPKEHDWYIQGIEKLITKFDLW